MHCAAVQLQLYFSFPDVVSFELGHGEAGLSLGSSVSGAGAAAGSSTGGVWPFPACWRRCSSRGTVLVSNLSSPGKRG